MWLITKIGFISIVEKPEDWNESTLTIRAKVQSDLENLRDRYLSALGAIREDMGTDYKSRAKAPRLEAASASSQIALDIDYSNFKYVVGENQGNARASFCHELWNVLHRLQTTAPVKHVPVETKKMSYGGVLRGSRKQILLRGPTGDFDGYVWTFPKGEKEPDAAPEETALRKVKGETGYTAEIVGNIGPVRRGTGRTEFLLIRPIG